MLSTGRTPFTEHGAIMAANVVNSPRSASFKSRGSYLFAHPANHDDKFVLLEILEASDFLAHLTKATMKAEGRGSVDLSADLLQ